MSRVKISIGCRELESEARRLDIRGRSKMGKDELRRAVARAKR